jgi:hypothetical protein
MLSSIYAHFFIYIENVQLKVTKSNVLSVDLVTFDFQTKQKETRGNFQLDSKQKSLSPH